VDEYVDEVLDIVELTPLKGSLVGTPGVSGLSVEERKRLTIAVELVANPSIIFMDEPTSGAGTHRLRATCSLQQRPHMLLERLHECCSPLPPR
jgi:energy-coupling factor transporter ATP-binding protein EcfA2